jgi:hypothetical protein
MSKFHVEMEIETDDDELPVDAEVVKNDVRDYVNGEFDGASFETLPQYGITVNSIEVTEVE